MNSVSLLREYFLDSIRAWLVLLGVPFRISLIYSTHTQYMNSAEPSWWLTLSSDFIHAFRMQVLFVTSGHFPYMLSLRYSSKRWWKVCVERMEIPMLTTISLLTLPQFTVLQYVKGKADSQHALGGYDKYNALAWRPISHLWSLLVLVALTILSIWVFTQMENRLLRGNGTPASGVSVTKLTSVFILLDVGYVVVRRTILILCPSVLSDGIFNFIVM